MSWYKFTIHYHGPGGIEETYKYYFKEPSEEFIKDDLREWADETETDDGHYGYHTNYEAIGSPPAEWLRDNYEQSKRAAILHQERAEFLAKELEKRK